MAQVESPPYVKDSDHEPSVIPATVPVPVLLTNSLQMEGNGTSDYGGSSPDSGHGTLQDYAPDTRLEPTSSSSSQSSKKESSISPAASDLLETVPENASEKDESDPTPHYAWIQPVNGIPPHQPVAINPEPGFTPVLVDSPAAYPWVAPPLHLHSHPPPAPPPLPAFLHPHHPYDVIGGESSVSQAPPLPFAPYLTYETGPPTFDPNFMPPPVPPSAPLYPTGRNRGSRGASLSPKRPSGGPNGRSNSANAPPLSSSPNGTGNSANTGRYTPSPSSAGSRGSRGSSPAQQQHPPLPSLNTPQLAPPTCTAVPMQPGEHVVHLHVNPGETIRLQIGGQVQVIQGPATVRMVSTTDSPPIPLPVQVPPGHVLQQIVDESGTLRHVILSPAPAQGILPLSTPSHPPPPAPHFSQSHNASQPPPHFYPSQGYGPQGGGGGGAYHYGNPPGMIHPHGHPMGPHHNSCQAHGPAPGYNVMSPPNSQGASSPPLGNFHSERARTQYNKLKKKLEQKLMKDANSGSGSTALNANVLRSPPTSPQKGVDHSHLGRKKDRNSNLEPVGSPDQDIGVDEGSNEGLFAPVKPPRVDNVTSRSVEVSWTPLPVINDSLDDKTGQELAYELLLVDRGVTRRISLGKETETLLDLRPASEYRVCLCALFDNGSVKTSDQVVFRTLPGPPDTPLPPKLVTRAKSSLQFRWTAPADNGAHLSHYIFEWDEGQGKQEFQEIYRGKAKQYTLIKLQASTCYAVRLAAVSELGMSEWSDIVIGSTSGTPPTPPAPPALQLATVDSLTLSWLKSPSDHLFTLQVADPFTGHGFLNEYHGPDMDHTCVKLYRSTPYKFRLQSQNDAGTSKWSEEVAYSTLPDKPLPPSRPAVKGKIHAQSFKVRWDPPMDNGGVPITQYTLELQGGLQSEFGTIWKGAECEALCDHLQPGSAYLVRVQCTNAGGTSTFSEPCSVTTEAVGPGQCPPPTLLGKAKASSLQLRWGPPGTDGGSVITNYEVTVTTPDNNSRIVYVGRETECMVASLLPGRPYLFQVRAVNKVAAGPWSLALEAVSGAGPPDAPREPKVVLRSPHTAFVSWEEPVNNGAIVNDFRLDMATPIGEDLLPEGDEMSLQYQTIYAGPANSFEVRGLAPALTCLFRVQAFNAAGASPYSPSGRLTTPPSTPAAPGGLRVEHVTSHSLSLAWNPAAHHGSAVTHYNVEWGNEKLIQATSNASPQITLTNLTPDTSYRLRVQGVNGMGAGAFSASIKATTQRSPPSPPRLECLAVGHNYLRLKWADKNVDFTQYTLEIRNSQDSEFYEEYQGSAWSYRVTRLEELTAYEFRICASNEVGQGPYSAPVSFITSRAPPPALKGVKAYDVTERSCKMEWALCSIPNSDDPIQYLIQLRKSRDPDEVKTEKTSHCSWTWDGLEPGMEYNVRVCPIRMGHWGELQGAFSPSTVFITTPLIPVKASSKPSSLLHVEKVRKPLTDQQRALIILSGFCLFALLVAVIVQLSAFSH